MALEVRGHPILSHGEFSELMKEIGDHEVPVFAAWFMGERVAPRTLWRALEEATLQVRSDRGHELISVAAGRLAEAFDIGMFEPMATKLPPSEPDEI